MAEANLATKHKPLMEDLSFLQSGPAEVVEASQLYHGGLLPGSPVSNLTLNGQSLPLVTVQRKNAADTMGSICEGAIISYTTKGHQKALAKLDNLVVEWIGRPDDEQIKGDGVGPGGQFVRSRVFDKTAPGFEPAAENCEPMSKYVFLFPVSDHAAIHTGIKPSVLEMRSGGGLNAEDERIASLEKELENRKRQRAMVAAAQQERAEAQEADANKDPARRGRPKGKKNKIEITVPVIEDTPNENGV